MSIPTERSKLGQSYTRETKPSRSPGWNRSVPNLAGVFPMPLPLPEAFGLQREHDPEAQWEQVQCTTVRFERDFRVTGQLIDMWGVSESPTLQRRKFLPRRVLDRYRGLLAIGLPLQHSVLTRICFQHFFGGFSIQGDLAICHSPK